MKVYVGTTVGGAPQGDADWKVWIEHAPDNLEPLPHEVHHSPDGFAWGYGGSGPADLAYNLLLDVLGEEGRPIVERTYLRFKNERLAPLNIDRGWRMTELSIRTWLANVEVPVSERLALPDCPGQHVRGLICNVCGGMP